MKKNIKTIFEQEILGNGIQVIPFEQGNIDIRIYEKTKILNKELTGEAVINLCCFLIENSVLPLIESRINYYQELEIKLKNEIEIRKNEDEKAILKTRVAQTEEKIATLIIKYNKIKDLLKELGGDEL